MIFSIFREIEDDWLQRSLQRSDKSDANFDQTAFSEDRVLFVYQSQLDELLSWCLNCGSGVIQ